MSNIYNTATTPNYYHPERNSDAIYLMEVVRDVTQLEYYWSAFRNATGTRMRGFYGDYVDLRNEAARENGLENAAEMEILPYESKTFMEDVEKTWEEIKPLYQELHAYARHKLNKL